MLKVHKLIATCFCIGYIGKGGGTVAALVCCIVWYMVQVHVEATCFLGQLLVTLFIIIIGIGSASKLDPYWGKDSSKVVIDEVAGMCVTLLFIPVQWKYLLVGLILFRFFDIAKPLLIRKTEKLPLGWGVMLDDLLAGLYSNLLLQVVVLSNFL